ncbi:bifunctional 5,10-methylene-tetrahydrofolate dehydrogenase/5,10-methylene-tetrahydrofolate cyclohydrolase [Marispirochaeta aestuarii]|uniref:Bifunctional protein FolD n=1 Tax=Marispirochaeta aestuarii TaxID=1963862 RepID=A0A1Y1S314_9SPIO|nr:bifunctional methylenetetrahydrofolate dehydrogenase/methenyltetrahydrofolate cyclohydrolase FolD [Marispirochaeta aestuarii]ORC37324.1 bifunctional 5,10-methylene-tetrahydrofolate dehydrogenase/5,10-methylene-tetrahydrofolate cyclohydrolase [Marispirochaeta aestuarii]
MANLIDGKKIAAKVREELKSRIDKLKKKGITPGLGVVLVGDDPASISYVTGKERACAELGMFSRETRLPAEITQEELLALIASMNEDPQLHGILVQLPLPRHIDEQKIIMAIDPKKDVDGFHPVNAGKMLLGQDCYLPCTPNGILKLLEESGVETGGAEVVVLGRSNIVGKPVANLLFRKANPGNSTVTICHTATRDLKAHTLRADILIVAAGRARTVTGDMVKEGAVVIDVGVNRIPDDSKKRGYRLEGDVDFSSVSEKASLITPVPGGVGPMTITMLLFNTVAAAEKSV